jgi:hypothetical protein
MIDIITDWLIARRLKKSLLNTTDGSDSEKEFRRVLNTLRTNKVMVFTKVDGIYIRLAGTESKGECYSEEIVKVKSFNKENTRNNKLNQLCTK